MDEPQTQLTGQKAELTFTVEVTRAATGEKETFEMIGTINNEDLTDVSNT